MTVTSNKTKQLAALRAQINNTEAGIERLGSKKEKDAAYDTFKPLKAELMKQIRQLNQAKDVHVIEQKKPYDKVFMFYKLKDKGEYVRTLLEKGVANNPDLYFMMHEVSPYLNRKLGRWTWADYSTDDADALKAVLANGYGDFKCLFADWRDRKGTAILVHESCPYNSLKDMGIITRLDNRTQSMKAAKYLHRLFANGDMNHTPRFGKEQEDSWIEHSQEAIIELENGETLIIKFVDLDSLNPEEVASVDGHIDLSLRAHRALGLSNNPKIGQSWSITILTRMFGKGHSRYVPHLSADIVIYGPKKLVGSNTEFVFMSLGVKHGTQPNTDIQSVTNFKLSGLMKEKFHQYCKLVYLSLHDEWLTTKLLMKTIRTAEIEESVMDFESKDTFILRKAMLWRISPFVFPGLYRRAYRFFMTSVANVSKWRVPLEIAGAEVEDKNGNMVKYSVAMSRYASGEPNVIMDDGSIDMTKSLIPEGRICIPDLEDGIDVIIYRQPNENTNAWYKLKNIRVPEYEGAVGQAVAYLGRGVDKVLGRLGGGDMDDNLIIIFDPAWVKHFDTLSYDEAGKIVSEAEVTEYYPGYDYDSDTIYSAVDTVEFNTDTMAYQIDVSSKSGLSIGSTVNACMDDYIKSDPVNKASMLAYLNEFKGDPDKDPDNQFEEAAKWLSEERETKITSFLDANLELVIDSQVKDPSLMAALNRIADEKNPDPMPDEFGVQGFIAAYHRIQRVYPMCMKRGENKRDRIPPNKQKAEDYVFALSEQCKDMEVMFAMVDNLQQKFVRNEWLLVKKADPKVADLMFPRDKNIMELVSGRKADESHPGLRVWWGMGWKRRFDPQMSSEDRYHEIMDRFMIAITRVKDVLPEMAVELYRQIYAKQSTTPRVDEVTRRTQTFNDGLLWTNAIGNAFLNAIHQAGLHGAMLNVRLYIEKQLGIGQHDIRVEKGFVYHQIEGKEEAIGEINPRVPNGKYVMDDGLVIVMEPHEAFIPRIRVLDMIEPLVSKRK